MNVTIYRGPGTNRVANIKALRGAFGWGLKEALDQELISGESTGLTLVSNVKANAELREAGFIVVVASEGLLGEVKSICTKSIEAGEYELARKLLNILEES